MNAQQSTETLLGFDQLNLAEPVLQAVKDSGYQTPSPIQAKIIPFMLKGRDVLGQAQTGTGKTAAFALPILSRINSKQRALQVLVLTPTRELAMQVCDSFKRYAAHLPGFQVAPIYGGKGYGDQLRALRDGVQVIVGTPGRLIDHIRNGKLSLDSLSTLVLDEADEMLRMGFIDDVQWILDQTPSSRQIALFSATMPSQIKTIAQRYLVNPIEVAIEAKTATAPLITQRYWVVSGLNKLDALTRILEQKRSDGVIVFARTKTATNEVAERLIERGFSAVAINGDLAQRQREQTISQLKSGKIDILVATDVAARGLDVERISHVINYDIPSDPESYVHRIGRTGRAGRQGEAILFVSPREMRMLKIIERITRQQIERMELPTVAEINKIRLENFQISLKENIEKGGFEAYYELLQKFQSENNADPLAVAAALARMLHGDKHFFMKESSPASEFDSRREREHNFERNGSRRRSSRGSGNFNRRHGRGGGERSERSDRGERSASDRGERGNRSERSTSERGERNDRGGNKGSRFSNNRSGNGGGRKGNGNRDRFRKRSQD